jgi:outer membrane protein, adhesin transport system
VEIALAGYRPQIDVGFGTAYDRLAGNRWRPRANVSASQMLFDFGKTASRVTGARADEQASEAQVLIAVDTIIRDTSFSVIEIQRSAALHEVALAQFDSIREISDLVERRYERGAATRSDALQARSRLDAARSALEQIDAEF